MGFCQFVLIIGHAIARIKIALFKHSLGEAEIVRQLHVRNQRGELSFRPIASEWRLPMCELCNLVEKNGLTT
jgi:hypothetical protein